MSLRAFFAAPIAVLTSLAQVGIELLPRQLADQLPVQVALALGAATISAASPSPFASAWSIIVTRACALIRTIFVLGARMTCEWRGDRVRFSSERAPDARNAQDHGMQLADKSRGSRRVAGRRQIVLSSVR